MERFLQRAISLLVVFMVTALSTVAMPMMPAASYQAEFFTYEEVDIAEHTNVHFAARAPSLTSTNVAFTCAAVAEHGNGMMMHGHETHVVSLGFGVGFGAPDKGLPSSYTRNTDGTISGPGSLSGQQAVFRETGEVTADGGAILQCESGGYYTIDANGNQQYIPVADLPTNLQTRGKPLGSNRRPIFRIKLVGERSAI